MHGTLNVKNITKQDDILPLIILTLKMEAGCSPKHNIIRCYNAEQTTI